MNANLSSVPEVKFNKIFRRQKYIFGANKNTLKCTQGSASQLFLIWFRNLEIKFVRFSRRSKPYKSDNEST